MSPGTKIGRYQIERELGHGGMGTVFLAEDPMIGRRVALKLIRLDDSGSAEQQRLLAQGFLKETRLAGVLHHPGVVGVFDAGRQDNLAYIVMEFIDGQTLDAMMRSEPRPELARLLDVCRQAAGVLDYAHAHGVIHRDIKPTNILVQHDGAVKICDFGIAKVMQSTEFTLTQTGMAVGTPEFMSPEQVLGQPLDGRSDQWSLAVVAYELVTGVKPFHADSYTQVMARIMTLDPEPACQQNPALPKAVDAVFAKALSKKPPDRFPNCYEFVAALEGACGVSPATAPVAAAPVTAATVVRATAAPTAAAPLPPAADSMTPIHEPARKAGPPWGLIAAIALVLAIVGGAAWFLLFRHSTPAAVETAQSPVSPETPATDRPRAVHSQPRQSAAPGVSGQPAAGQPATRGKPAPENLPVRLVTVPEGAATTIDNRPDSACQSPCSVELSAGQHTIQAKKEGYYPLVKTFQIDPQQSEISFTLDQIMGSVMIETEPAGASISVNGAPRTETTPANIHLPVGQYKVNLTKEGFDPFEYDVTVRADALSRAKATLAKSSH
jgi:serine/threonine-protein kinase